MNASTHFPCPTGDNKSIGLATARIQIAMYWRPRASEGQAIQEVYASTDLLVRQSGSLARDYSASLDDFRVRFPGTKPERSAASS